MPLMAGSFEQRLRVALSQGEPDLSTVDGARDAAVLIPIVGSPQPTLVFTIRTETVSSHKGQISFPGGSVDTQDASLEATALREAYEELGIEARDVEILGRLDSVPTFVSGYVIHPFVGWLERVPPLVPNSDEVASVMLVPVVDLTDDVRARPGDAHRGRSYPTEFWVWQDNVIWGATARIIRLLLHALDLAGLAPAPARSEPWPPPPVPSPS
jgi:8-oxo-dGTP pyrophosphatase MutT (NUDIX family)